MESGDDLSSRAVSSQVLSALKVLTSVFGMGTGGTPSPLSPEIVTLLWAVRYVLAQHTIYLLYPLVKYFFVLASVSLSIDLRPSGLRFGLLLASLRFHQFSACYIDLPVIARSAP